MTNFHPFRWPIRVYYEDTDVGGLVYHANFLKYFERARSELLREIGVNQVELFEQNTSFVVSRIEMDFKKGARFDDQLTVETWVTQMKRASLQFTQRIVDKQGLLYCEALVTVVCVDPTSMKPKSSPLSQKHIAEMLSER
ncbi:tol-pal system-associated acyl-CoA thioesterase [Veronia pacifica]|uniref:Tol-pal system-associated acyl-CoA thioesterase n=1 Tax=Veronia pacifica TaxID=1080227 RepID=A0A1C3ERZ4_9GAMM|nr:tol-pal system-associated acyl-CoA thioesterase [Veronia pacifica]ODA35958.1 tol-pal system-associated acyl-CoA thioesterase [Veronia pacifica]